MKPVELSLILIKFCDALIFPRDIVLKKAGEKYKSLTSH